VVAPGGHAGARQVVAQLGGREELELPARDRREGEPVELEAGAREAAEGVAGARGGEEEEPADQFG